MKKFLWFVILIFSIQIIHGFPLKKLKKGDHIDISSLKPVNIKGEVFHDKKVKKILFLWRLDKRLSKKSAKKFIKVCRERKIICISIETKGASIEQQLKILKKVPETVYFAQNDKVVNEWGIFTLPVTIFLDKNNKIIHAVGYEGQYVTKIERYIDFLEGKITKEQLEKAETQAPSYKKSILPDLNYILTLIKENQVEDAEKKLKEIGDKIKIENLNVVEKISLIKVLIKLKKYDYAEKIINSLNKFNPHVKFYKGIICFEKKNYDDALKSLKEIEKIYPDKKVLYYYIGKIYKLKGDCKNAAEYFEKVFNFINISY